MTKWVMYLPSRIFTRIMETFSAEIKSNLNMTDDNFSSVSSSNTGAIFPFVYVHLLPAVETGRDLEGITINGGLFTFQIEVTDNQSQNRAGIVMTEILRIMKAQGFEVVAMPEFKYSDSYRCTARFRRNIAHNDIL